MKKRKTAGQAEMEKDYRETYYLSFIIGILLTANAVLLGSHILALGGGLLAGWALRRVIEKPK